MYLTIKQQAKHLSKADYNTLKELCHIAKSLTNQAIYNIRQGYLNGQKYLSFPENYAILKSSPNYKALNSNMAQQLLKEVDASFKSFFSSLSKAKQNNCSHKHCKLPQYLPKDGYATLIIGFVRINGNSLVIPYSNSYRKTHSKIKIKIPPILLDKKVKEIRIVPKANARFFEIQYTYQAEVIQRNINKNNALALDLGVNNLVTAVSSSGNSFIIDGKRLKSINQWFNKNNARLQSIKAKQRLGLKSTSQQNTLANNRCNKVNDYMSKSARIIIDYCIKNDIGTLVVGYNESFQSNCHLGHRNNQNFEDIPYGRLYKKLEYLCKINCIILVKQEESYTSKASFWDKDPIPVYDDPNSTLCSFSGKRISRGLYRTNSGRLLNADINGALNILRKSNVVSLNALYTSGEVDTPVRIRIA